MSSASKHPFTQDRETFDRLGNETVRMLGAYLRALPDQHVDRVVPADVRQRLISLPLPEHGQSADEILEFLRREVMPWPIATGHKRSYGWVSSPPAPIAVLADAISSTMNCGLDGFDHGAIFLMKTVGRWIMELVGFPVEGSLCILHSGGSSATLNALTAARHRAAARDGWNMRTEGLQSGRKRLVFYTSAESHSSVQKCAEQLGIGTDNLRAVEVDDDFRMKPSALRAAIEADLKAGHLPFAIVACSGSTNTGSIDPLDEIADIAEELNIWLHIDGAFGAWAALDPAYRDKLRAFARVDSITLNPHKWLQVPVDCGALLTRHPDAHQAAHSLTPDYLDAGSSEAPWPYEYMFQLTYGNRALKVWAAIARLGRAGVAELVTRCNALAKSLERQVLASKDFELLSPASLSVVNFRYRPAGTALDDAALDDLNERISAGISESGEAHIPTTRVHGKTALRVCFLHYENDEGDVTHLLGIARRIARGLGA